MVPPDRLARVLRARFGAVDVRPAGEGGDHVAWHVRADDGAWVVRVPRAGAADGPDGSPGAAAGREVAVLELVRRGVGRWAPEARVLDAAAGITACRWVPGTPLQDRLAARAVGPADRARLGAELGAFARDVAAVDVARGVAGGGAVEVVVDDAPLAEWRAGAVEMVAAVAPTLDAAAVRRIEMLLAADPPPDAARRDLVLAHNDLGAEHVVVDDDLVVVGVIDWSDSAVADPAGDLGRVLRDLGETAFVRALDAVAGADARADRSARAALAARARYLARWLAIEDLAYALDRRPDLVALGRRNLERLLSGE
jgi:aminoglycoside phosphotransferase (APT) family kinase protein